VTPLRQSNGFEVTREDALDEGLLPTEQEAVQSRETAAQGAEQALDGGEGWRLEQADRLRAGCLEHEPTASEAIVIRLTDIIGA
jgi:hypothetical protein